MKIPNPMNLFRRGAKANANSLNALGQNPFSMAAPTLASPSAQQTVSGMKAYDGAFVLPQKLGFVTTGISNTAAAAPAAPEVIAQTAEQGAKFFSKSSAQFSKMGADVKGLFSNIGGAFSSLGGSLKGGAGFAGRAADSAVGAGAWIARAPVRAASGVFGSKTFRVPALIGTIVGGVVVANKVIRGRAEARTVEELQAQYAQPSAPAGTYQVTPEEYAAMQAQFRQGGQGQGFAEAEMARRAAAQQQANPTM